MTAGLHAVVVTGLSGSGKSTALKVLEDLGFYCIDNLPVGLVPRFLELWQSSQEDIGRVALGIDVRERRFLHDVPGMLDELRAAEVQLEVIYLEASDDVLVRRFSETRRPHPAAEGGAVVDGIRRERDALRGVRELADRIIDTSAFTVHELRAALRELLETPESGRMTISLVSFGYKHGLPTDADIALDCRFLPTRSSWRSCVPRPAPIPTWRRTSSSVPTRRSSWSTCWGCCASRSRASSTRARAISPSRWAAPAAGIARSCWSRSCALA
jgi:UPF0042 nucleotide-binding protein